MALKEDGILTPYVRLELLQKDVGRYLKEDVGHKEDGQCYVVLGRARSDSKIFFKAKDCCIRNVRPADAKSINGRKINGLSSGQLHRVHDSPIQKCKEVQDAQTWYQPEIDLGHQPPCSGMARCHHLLLIIIVGLGQIRIVEIATGIAMLIARMRAGWFAPFFI